MVPSKQHPKWKDLVTGKTQPAFTLLAAKFLISRLTMAAKTDPSPGNVEKLINEAHKFFSENERIADKDIKAIFG
ncbi:hypothetical protein [Derxia gummosa]|uniref:Uncharacterized protein n=1 Tax=Derxia gummosa DSM 723 TaxID=1121388 RepID=A0A8B6X8Q5_9BURK|nr:hypothetical protein [Derxia gummosa]